MKGPLSSLSRESCEQLREARQPSSVTPMLATLAHEPFSEEGWLYERKLDGERCLAFRRGRRVRLRTRNHQALNATYPELVDALGKQRCDDFIVDGEVVAFSHGVTSFSRLQQRLGLHRTKEARASGVAVYYYLFDILHVNGYDTTKVPLRDRKSLLKKTISFADPLRFTPHRVDEGEAFFRSACRKGWEGVIGKEAAGRYTRGRSRDWLKFKCENQQEFVIGGFTDPRGSRVGFGALLIGYYKDDDLRYAGMVGTGFDDDTLKRLVRCLKKFERKTPPFADSNLPGKRVHWVSPRLVLEAAFTEWTDGKLRHPRYVGLRSDKLPERVVRETTGS